MSRSNSAYRSYSQQHAPSVRSANLSSDYWSTVLLPSPSNSVTPSPSSSSSSTTTSHHQSLHHQQHRYDPHMPHYYTPINASQPPHPSVTSPISKPGGASSDKPFVCETCGTAFKKNSNLAKHMKLVHLGERNFACPEPGCGRLFGQKSNLNSHIKAVHRGEKPYVCDEPGCGKRFSQKSGLKAHIKTVHHGERPYVCPECNSSFGHRGDLNRHIRVLHEQQRPFTCPICPEPRSFGRKSVLMRHMQTHDTSRNAATAHHSGPP